MFSPLDDAVIVGETWLSVAETRQWLSVYIYIYLQKQII